MYKKIINIKNTNNIDQDFIFLLHKYNKGNILNIDDTEDFSSNLDLNHLNSMDSDNNITLSDFHYTEQHNEINNFIKQVKF